MTSTPSSVMRSSAARSASESVISSSMLLDVAHPGELDDADHASPGHDDAMASGGDHPSLDLGLGKVDVGDATRRVDAVAADECHRRVDVRQDALAERVDERVLHRSQCAAGDDDEMRGKAASSSRAIVSPLVITDDVLELATCDDRPGHRRRRGAHVDEDRVAALDAGGGGGAEVGDVADPAGVSEVERALGAVPTAGHRATMHPAQVTALLQRASGRRAP